MGVEMEFEPSFPRGGREKIKSAVPEKPLKRKQVDDLFGSTNNYTQKDTKKQAKKEKPAVDKGFDLNLKLKIVDPLNYKLMTEGMLILGCIQEVHRYHLMVSLPGKTSGRVPITSISRQYSEAIESLENVPMLSELFHIGQHVVTKVMSISAEGSYHQVTLSMVPDDIHSELSHSSLKEGMVLTGALSSIEDHGYLIEFGIKSLRGFLKKKDTVTFMEANSVKELVVGQLLRCHVSKVKSAVASTTVELSADPTLVDNTLYDPSCGMNPHLVVPGMKFEVTAVMPLLNGVLMKWLKYDGYVHVDHLPDPSKPFETQFKAEDQISATVLYSLPLIRTVYFTMQQPAPFGSGPLELEESGFPKGCNVRPGEVIDSAEVVTAAYKGITLKLKKGKVRGFVYSSQMAKIAEGEDLRSKYPAGSRVQCRVLKYDMMDRVFFCTMLKEKINDKVLVAADVEAGLAVNCVITEVRKQDLIVQINNWHHLKAKVPATHLSDANISDISKRFTKGQRIKGRVLFTDLEKNAVQVTLKPSWVNSTKPILASYDEVSPEDFFQGVVVCIQPKFYLISFYNDVTGKLSKDSIPAELRQNFTLGQNVNVRVEMAIPKAAKLQLSMTDFNEKQHEQLFEVGREYNAVIGQVMNQEIMLKISLKNCEGIALVPKSLVCLHKTLSVPLMSTFSPGDKVKATCLLSSRAKNIFTIDHELASILKNGLDESLKVYSLLPGLVKSFGKTGVVLSSLSRKGDSKAIFVAHKSIADEPIDNKRSVFTENQGLLCRIEGLGEAKEADKAKKHSTAQGSTKLMDICPYGVHTGGSEMIQNYLRNYAIIFEHMKKEKNVLATFCPGQMVQGKISKAQGTGMQVELDSGVKGHLSSYHSHGSSLKVNQEVNAVVIWVDVCNNAVQLSVRPDVLKQINKDQVSCSKPALDSTQRGEVVYVTDDLVVVLLKGQCRGLITCAPAKIHVNDLAPDLYQLGSTCKFVFKDVSTIFAVCVNKRNLPMKGKKPKLHPGSLEHKIQSMDKAATKNSSKKRSLDDGDVQDHDSEVKVDREILDAPDEELEVSESAPAKKKRLVKPTTAEPETLSVSGFVWDVAEVKEEQEDSSSDEENDDEAPKKKLTLAERRALAHKEEEKLVKAEQKLMNEDQTPQSADEFDRLLMASPDSSIVWVQFMAFHLQATEIEKARAVARKALKTISFREEQEKLNVWVALLNLENLYGTSESLEKTLQEAVQASDASKVYTQLLKIFADTNKVEEGTSLFETMLRKFRADKETWVQGGNFFFQSNQLEKGRHLLQRALKSLENKHHVYIICKFAHLENKYGSAERCHTLFEHILTSFPKRTDIWSSYADLLIKADNIEATRNLLERGISQKLPVRKMKALFKKYLEFAQQHGTSEEVESVKSKAQNFVQSVAANMPKDDGSDDE